MVIRVMNSFGVMVRVRVRIRVYVKLFCSTDDFWASELVRARLLSRIPLKNRAIYRVS